MTNPNPTLTYAPCAACKVNFDPDYLSDCGTCGALFCPKCDPNCPCCLFELEVHVTLPDSHAAALAA